MKFNILLEFTESSSTANNSSKDTWDKLRINFDGLSSPNDYSLNSLKTNIHKRKKI